MENAGLENEEPKLIKTGRQDWKIRLETTIGGLNWKMCDCKM